MRIAIFPYGVSGSVNALKDAINAQFPNNPARKLLPSGSAFRGRADDLVINWGSSSVETSTFATITGVGSALNLPAAIRTASMKTEAFLAMSQAGVTTVPFTTDGDVATEWIREGKGVFARNRLQGHSGEGIIYFSNNPVEDLGNVTHERLEGEGTVGASPLYTQAIEGSRREFRIHVIKGKIQYVQLKRRRSGYRENPDYSNIVRNHGNGWVYANSNVAPNDAALLNAVKAVEACGLDFGAVDVITNRDDAWVLEINTAPGLEGTTLDTYTEAFTKIANGTPLVHILPEGTVFPGPVVPTPPVPVEELEDSSDLEFTFDTVGNTAAPSVVPSPITPETQEIAANIRASRVRGPETLSSSRPMINSEAAPVVVGTIPAIPAITRRELLGSRLFTLVSDIIGDYAAELELSRVISSGARCEFHEDINRAMNWSSCPQEHEFWSSLHNHSVAPTGYTVPVPTVPVEEGVPTEEGAIVDGGFYQVQVDDEVTLAQYSEGIDGFFLIGFDVPVSLQDLNILTTITV